VLKREKSLLRGTTFQRSISPEMQSKDQKHSTEAQYKKREEALFKGTL